MTNKPSLTVIVGAGASVPLDIPSTGALTCAVERELLSHDAQDCANFGPRIRLLLKAVRDYHGDAYNFEYLWDALEAAVALTIGWQKGSSVATSEAALTIARPDVRLALDRELLIEALFVMKRKLTSKIRDASEAATKRPEWSTYQEFWQGLASTFSLTVVTLNYDTLIEQSLRWKGEHQGMRAVSNEGVWRLDPKRMSEPRSGHRLFHLHGSIQFGRREHRVEINRFAYEDSRHELYWHPTVASAQETTTWHPSSRRSQAGRQLEGAGIITGQNKPDKLLVEPMLSYQVELVNQLSREARLLVIGYGFGDTHVNCALERMTRIHGNSTRACVIDNIDVVDQIGSTQRANLVLMLQRWGRTSFTFGPFHPDPWASDNGCARLDSRGFLASDVSEVLCYFDD